ncbi:MAG: polyprenyl synthetase family protein [Bacteroidaceae bacterium]|nr:polyprenyl synthetase family protein [Bacteroidaceae bacterium]
MQLTSQQITELIGSHIDKLTFSHEPANLYAPVRYALSMGGKRIRPVLMLLAYNLYKPDVDVALDPAAAIEIYHNFTLLHDDLMDKADMRRGQLTVHRKWDANTAVLSGDVMLSLADTYMSHCDDRHYRAVMETFSRTSIEIAEGQQYDMDFESRDNVTEAEYIEMIRLKTSVLLACSMKIGATLADASAEDVENIYKAGEQMGLAFQLHDDYLDVYGDSKVFGKKVGGDILCNKKTFLYVKSMELADGEQRGELDKWFATEGGDAAFCETKIREVTRLYSALEMPRICREQEDFYYHRAHAYLDKVHVAEEAKKELRAYLASMMNRVV